MPPRWTWLVAVTIASFSLHPTRCAAGPPFLTDDPETTEPRHWEIYVAGFSGRESHSWTGAGPFFDVNYGLVPDVQLHVGFGVAGVWPANEGPHFGYGDTELGAKIRFVNDESAKVQLSVYPTVFLPTGDATRELGAGYAQLLLPLWVQKTWGEVTTYAGVGYTFVVGPHDQNQWFFGWAAQVRLASWVSTGGELFVLARDAQTISVGANLGVMFDIDETHHILASVGGHYDGAPRPQGYIAYQITFGPM